MRRGRRLSVADPYTVLSGDVASLARKALELLTALAIFTVMVLVIYQAWTLSGSAPHLEEPSPDGEVQSSPPPDSPENAKQNAREGNPTPAALPRRLPGVDSELPTSLAALLDQWETPVLQAHVSTSMDHAAPTQQDNIALTAERLAGTVLRPGEAFSFVHGLGPFDRAHGYGCGRTFVGNRIAETVGGGVCQVASTLYNAVVLADLEVLERHPHSLTVPYLPPGQDATISGRSDKDFRFLNDTTSPVVIWSTAADIRLHVWIFGRTPPPQVTWRHRTLSRSPFQTVREMDPALSAGEERLESPGQDGVVVHSTIIVHRDGVTQSYDLGTNRYRPSPRIIRVGVN